MAAIAPGNRVDLAVIGGGITGLAAAHRLVEEAVASGRDLSVVVLEASDRVGGQIRTERHGDLLLEAGPDALVAQKPAAVLLCERLGLGPELRSLGGAGARTEILHRGRLHPVPEGFLMMAPTRVGPLLRSSLFTWRGKLRMLCEPFVSPRARSVEDESAASFVTRRFGREALERVAGPVVGSLFTADVDRLSVRLAAPRFFDLEVRHGSVTRGLMHAGAFGPRPFGHGTGRSGFVTLGSGLSRIVDALIERLPAGTVRTSARVDAIAPSPIDGAWSLALSDGRTISSEAVIHACPAPAAAAALRTHDAELADLLSRIRYASCATVNLAYRRSDVASPPRSYGFFVPKSEGLPILACSHVTEKFERRAPGDVAVFRAFVGGALDPGILGHDDDTLARITHDTLARIFAIGEAPVFSRVHRADGAMPQFDVGTGAIIAAIESRAAAHRGLFFAGSITGAFGLPDCIRSGEEAAERALAYRSRELRVESREQLLTLDS